MLPQLNIEEVSLFQRSEGGGGLLRLFPKASSLIHFELSENLVAPSRGFSGAGTPLPVISFNLLSDCCQLDYREVRLKSAKPGFITSEFRCSSCAKPLKEWTIPKRTRSLWALTPRGFQKVGAGLAGGNAPRYRLRDESLPPLAATWVTVMGMNPFESEWAGFEVVALLEAYFKENFLQDDSVMNVKESNSK